METNSRLPWFVIQFSERLMLCPAVAAEMTPRITIQDYCGDCYGSQTKINQCCNTCNELKSQYLRSGRSYLEAELMIQVVGSCCVCHNRFGSAPVKKRRLACSEKPQTAAK